MDDDRLAVRVKDRELSRAERNTLYQHFVTPYAILYSHKGPASRQHAAHQCFLSRVSCLAD